MKRFRLQVNNHHKFSIQEQCIKFKIVATDATIMVKEILDDINMVLKNKIQKVRVGVRAEFRNDSCSGTEILHRNDKLRNHENELLRNEAMKLLEFAYQKTYVIVIGKIRGVSSYTSNMVCKIITGIRANLSDMKTISDANNLKFNIGASINTDGNIYSIIENIKVISKIKSLLLATCNSSDYFINKIISKCRISTSYDINSHSIGKANARVNMGDDNTYLNGIKDTVIRRSLLDEYDGIMLADLKESLSDVCYVDIDK